MSQLFVVHAEGEDRPGRASAFLDTLSKVGVRVLEVEHRSRSGRVSLSLLVDGGEKAALLDAASEVGWDLEVAERLEEESPSVVLTVVGMGTDPGRLGRLLSLVEGAGGSVEEIARRSERALGVSVVVRGALDGFRQRLFRFAGEEGLDLSVEGKSSFGKRKGLVVFDMDSTLIGIEVIDELARAHGVFEKVSSITERAMRGELDFHQSLSSRVALLRGLDAGVLDELSGRLPLTEGAESLVWGLRSIGCKIAVVSGGFTVAAEALRSRLGLDHAHANELEVVDGKLTGGLVGPIVDAERKATLLEEIAEGEGIPLDRVVAVGDGANDRLMLDRAGLGVAFHGKESLLEAADATITQGGLDRILCFLGFP